MAIEIEKKYRLNEDQRGRILKNLKEENATFIRDDFEINEIYGGGILKEMKAVLRIRKTADKTILTFKKRIHNASDIKQQVEHETEVGDAEAMQAIVESLGFKKVVVYEKQRATWKFKNTEVVLDELPFGLFMEIEGQITDIALAEILLDAEDLEAVTETYPQMTLRLGKENGEIIEARFEKET
ncbi:MAG: class IV adenylate cyclase [Pyrinomonadaceae bacterium]